MARQNVYHHALNVGEVDKLALGRIDLTKMKLAAEVYDNFLATTLGPMRFRPGTQHLGFIPSLPGVTPPGFALTDTARVRLIPFDRALDDTAIIALTQNQMRVWVDDKVVVRAPVAATVTNQTFIAGLTGWSTALSTGATAIGSSEGLQFAAVSLGGSAVVHQTVATGSGDVEHALRIVVTRGPVTLSIGTSFGDSSLVRETQLIEGVHSIAFTPPPTGFCIQFLTQSVGPRVISFCGIEAAGDMIIPTPWDLVSLKRLQTSPSGDVIFMSDGRNQQRRIERRSKRSWSLTLYQGFDGPTSIAPAKRAKLTPAATTGVTSISSSEPVFEPAHAGSLIRLFNGGQFVEAVINVDGEFTPAIRVTGVGADRGFEVAITGTFTGTVALQRSFDDAESGFTTFTTYTAATVIGVNDTLDNQIVYYRLGFPPGFLSSGGVTASLRHSGGGGAGIARITSVATPSVVFVDVLERFYNVNSTTNWQFSDWSGVRGWPAGVTFFDGRLFWGDRFYAYGSKSDAFDRFTQDEEGAASAIIRSVGTGTAIDIRWFMPLQRMIAGTAAAEVSIRSSSFDAPLTREDFTFKNASSYGCSHLAPMVIDKSGVFVAKDEETIIEMAYSVDAQDYQANDLTRLNPSVCSGGVRATAVQRHPDTRLWHVLNNGTARVLLYERAEEAIAWQRFTTQGHIEAVAVVSARQQDVVYFAIERGGSMRLEKMAYDRNTRGGVGSWNLDAAISYSGLPNSTISGLGHIEGFQAYVYADDVGYGPFTVTGGTVTLPVAVTQCVAGLYYEGTFVSAKLAYVSQQTPMGQRKRIDHVGLVVADTHHDALLVGQDVSNLVPMARVENEEIVPPNRVWPQKDYESLPVDGRWSEDARLVIRARAPYPATVQAVTFSLSGHDKV